MVVESLQNRYESAPGVGQTQSRIDAGARQRLASLPHGFSWTWRYACSFLPKSAYSV
jgi:hypothetical protein